MLLTVSDHKFHIFPGCCCEFPPRAAGSPYMVAKRRESYTSSAVPGSVELKLVRILFSPFLTLRPRVDAHMSWTRVRAVALVLAVVRSCGASCVIDVHAQRPLAELRHFWTSSGFWLVHQSLRTQINFSVTSRGRITA